MVTHRSGRDAVSPRSGSRSGRRPRPAARRADGTMALGAPGAAAAALELLLQVLTDIDAGDGVLVWLLDGRGRLTGLLAGPATWPIADGVTDLLVEHALDDGAAAVIVVRRRAGPALVSAEDAAGFAAFDATCAAADLDVLWHLVDTGSEIVVVELR
jgi:hypothetical protein